MFMMWECWMLETINVKSSNIYWDKTVTDPLLFFECYFFSGYMLTIFLFLFLLIQPLIWDKLLKGTWLFPLKTLLSFHLLFYIISSCTYASVASHTSQWLSKLHHQSRTLFWYIIYIPKYSTTYWYLHLNFPRPLSSSYRKRSTIIYLSQISPFQCSAPRSIKGVILLLGADVLTLSTFPDTFSFLILHIITRCASSTSYISFNLVNISPSSQPLSLSSPHQFLLKYSKASQSHSACNFIAPLNDPA